MSTCSNSRSISSSSSILQTNSISEKKGKTLKKLNQLTLVPDYVNAVPIHFFCQRLLQVRIVKVLHVPVELQFYANLLQTKQLLIRNLEVSIFFLDHFLALCAKWKIVFGKTLQIRTEILNKNLQNI